MKKELKGMSAFVLSLAIILSMFFWGNEIGVYANDETFADWMKETEAEIANADHIIGPNGDVTTNNYTLIMPGETIGIRPDWVLSNNSIQGNITKFSYNVCQLEDPIIITTYLTNDSSKQKAAAFTPIKARTVVVPFGDRSILDPPKDDAVASHTGLDTYTYTSLYRNDTGLPVVLKGNSYNCPCTQTVEYTQIDGKNSNNLTNFQGSIAYHTKAEMYFLEPSYDITMTQYSIYDSFSKGSIDDVFWPSQVPTEINITHGSQTITFPIPVLKGHRFTKIIVDKCNILWESSDTKVATEDSIEYTYNLDTYLNAKGVAKIADNVISPEFNPGYLTGEFHAQGGTINGLSSYQLEIGSSYISIDINDYVPIRDGYTFKGWCKNPDNPEIIADTTPNMDHDWVNDEYADNFHTDLYAVWEKKAYTISFDANGGAGIMDSVKKYYGETYILPECGFAAPNGKEFDEWDQGAAGKSITITDNTTITAKWKNISAVTDNTTEDTDETSDVKMVTKVVSLTEVSDAIKASGYTTVEAVETQLRLVASDEGFDSKNSATYEVKLQISTDNGATWIDATTDNFPGDGLTIHFDYPEGTDSSYDFVIVHMFGENMNGHRAGQTETFSGNKVSKRSDGIYVTVTGLSPFLLSWKEGDKSTNTVTTDTSNTAKTNTTTADTTQAKASTNDKATVNQTSKSPATGDNTTAVPIIVLLVSSSIGLLYLKLKKRI